MNIDNSFNIKYLLSNGTGIDSSPKSLAGDSISSLGKGNSKWEYATVTAPTTPGTYNITVQADSDDNPEDIVESNEDNNYFKPPVVIKVAISNAKPEGNFDAADCTSIRGWTRDPDTTNPINVHFYVDGPSGSGTFVGQMFADGYREDLPFSDKNHGFNFQLPISLKNGLNHSIYAYAIDNAGGENPLLNGSPKDIKCINPAIMSIITDLILNGDDGKPAISVTPPSLDLGNVNIGQSSTPQTITLQNSGDAALNIGILSSSSPEFTLLDDSCSKIKLAVSATCTFNVIFTPSITGEKEERISLPSNDPNKATVFVALKADSVVDTSVNAPINGTCGDSNNAIFLIAPSGNLCITGTETSVTGTGPWSWTCTGANGGATANCNANKKVIIATMPGDSDSNGIVTIAEVQSAINMFLGLKELHVCVDLDNTGSISISEVQKVINSFCNYSAHF